jgi:hypothetical protein
MKFSIGGPTGPRFVDFLQLDRSKSGKLHQSNYMKQEISDGADARMANATVCKVGQMLFAFIEQRGLSVLLAHI